MEVITINLSILDFKVLFVWSLVLTQISINLSILDFKAVNFLLLFSINDYKSIHIGF